MEGVSEEELAATIGATPRPAATGGVILLAGSIRFDGEAYEAVAVATAGALSDASRSLFPPGLPLGVTRALRSAAIAAFCSRSVFTSVGWSSVAIVVSCSGEGKPAATTPRSLFLKSSSESSRPFRRSSSDVSHPSTWAPLTPCEASPASRPTSTPWSATISDGPFGPCSRWLAAWLVAHTRKRNRNIIHSHYEQNDIVGPSIAHYLIPDLGRN